MDYRLDGDAWLEGEEGVPLVPVRRKNMTPNSKPEGKALRASGW